MSEPLPQPPFDYQSLDEATRAFVQKKTDETHGLMKRTTEYIIEIGQNLLEVQQRLPEMKFSAWLRAEFNFSRRTAYNFMKVATKFGESCATVAQLPAKVLYELASCSDAIVVQVETGQMAPTLDAIRAAKEAEWQAREGERQAHEQVQAARQRLSSLQETSQEQKATIEQLMHELESLRTRLAELSTPEVQIQEVEKQVAPPEITAELTRLQQKVRTLTQQRDTLSEQVAHLQQEARAEVLERHEGEHERRVRLNWYQVTGEYHRCVVKLLAQWPTPLDVFAFEADDWTRLEHTRELSQRFLEHCTALAKVTSGSIIDSSTGPVEEAGGQ